MRISAVLLCLLAACDIFRSTPTEPSVTEVAVEAGYGTGLLHLGMKRSAVTGAIGRPVDTLSGRVGYHDGEGAYRVAYDSDGASERIEFYHRGAILRFAAETEGRKQPGVKIGAALEEVTGILGTGDSRENCLYYDSRGAAVILDGDADTVVGLIVFTPRSSPDEGLQFEAVALVKEVDIDGDGSASERVFEVAIGRGDTDGRAVVFAWFRESSDTTWQLFFVSDTVSIDAGEKDTVRVDVGGGASQQTDILIRACPVTEGVCVDTVLVELDEESALDDLMLADLAFGEEGDVDGDGKFGLLELSGTITLPPRQGSECLIFMVSDDDTISSIDTVDVADTAASFAVYLWGTESPLDKPVLVIAAAVGETRYESPPNFPDRELPRHDLAVAVGLTDTLDRDRDGKAGRYWLAWEVEGPPAYRDTFSMAIFTRTGSSGTWKLVTDSPHVVLDGTEGPVEGEWERVAAAADSEQVRIALVHGADDTVFVAKAGALLLETPDDDPGFQWRTAGFSDSADLDGDGYFSLLELAYDIDITSGSDTVILNLFYRSSGASSWGNYIMADTFEVAGATADDRRTETIHGGGRDDFREQGELRLVVMNSAGNRVLDTVPAGIRMESRLRDALWRVMDFAIQSPTDNDGDGRYSAYQVAWDVDIEAAGTDTTWDSVYVKIYRGIYNVPSQSYVYARYMTTEHFVVTEAGGDDVYIEYPLGQDALMVKWRLEVFNSYGQHVVSDTLDSYISEESGVNDRGI